MRFILLFAFIITVMAALDDTKEVEKCAAKKNGLSYDSCFYELMR